MIHGRNLIIYADGVAIAAAKSCTVSMSIGDIEAASDIDGNAKTFLPTQKEWTVRCNTLVTSLTGHFANIGDTIRLSMAVCDWEKNPTTDRMTGDAIVTSASITASVGNLVTGSFSFKGTGALERPRVRLRDNQGTPLSDSQSTDLYAIGQI
jgi:hypothetical protein